MVNIKLHGFLLTSLFFALSDGYAGIGTLNRTTSQAVAKQLSNRLIKPQLKIKNSSGRILKMTGNHKFLAFLLNDGSIRVWDLQIGVQRPAITTKTANFSSIALDPELELILAGNEKGHITATEILTSRPVFSLKTKNQSPVIEMLISNNGTLIASFQDGAVVCWDLRTKLEKWRILFKDSVQKLTLKHPSWAGVIGNRVEVRSLEDGKLIRNLSPLDEEIVYVSLDESGDKGLVGYSTGKVVLVNLLSGEKDSDVEIGDGVSVMESDGEKLFAAYSPDTKKLFSMDRVNGTKILMDNGGLEIENIRFTGKKNQLFATDKEGGINLFDIRTGKKILRLISTRQGWTVLDRVGRFDTSEAGLPNISWDADGHEIPLDKFSERYYEPGLLAQVITSENEYLNKEPPVVEEGIYLPPKIKIALDDDNIQLGKPARLTVEAFDQGGEINQVRVFHNGKALSLENAIVKDQNKKDKRLEMDIFPVGGGNILEVVALDRRGVESKSVSLNFQIPGLDSEDIALHIVAIGINDYADPRLDLDYSVADAESVAGLIRENKLLNFNKMEEHTIYNSNATRNEILRSIREAGQYSQNDVLAIYMAGHGIVVDSEWYFLPHETILQPDAGYYSRVGISAQQIKDLLIGSRAQKILLMVDSCYSGAGISAFNALINSQRHMGRSLSRSVGIIVLTAARRNQEAAELADLGHGLFTYAVTKGMEGNADMMPRDRKISAYEIVDFTKKEIPLLARKYEGASQEPVAFRMGKDFHLLSISK